ncbi:MAG TPA: hypothetical protein VF377_14425 [Acidimicrobiia bacterium]
MSLGVALVVFVLSGLVVAWAGIRLSAAGDEVAETTGLSGLFVGTILVAGATSLPEIVTNVAAAASGAPDLAVANLFGSNAFNMAILGIVDLAGKYQVWNRIEGGHARVASIAIALTALAVLSVLVRPRVSVGWVGIDTLFIAGNYVATLAWMRRSPVGRFHTQSAAVSDIQHVPTSRGNVRRALFRFGVAAALILVSAPVMAESAEAIAAATGIGQTFIGATLLAAVTSAPELVSCLAAVRIGAHDLAVGNLFGSNAFNMATLLIADVAYLPGPIMAEAHPAQAVSGVLAILLTAIALAAIVHGAETRIYRMEPDAIVILAMYVVGMCAVWAVS